MRKGLLLSLPLLLSMISLRAQPTLTQSSVGPIGSVFYMGSDTDFPPGTTVGGSGASQSWNFAGLNVNEYDTVSFIDPASTPYASDFPSSNLCVQQASLGNAFAYAVSDQNYFELIGYAADPFGFNQTFIIHQDPALRLANFPFTYQDSYLDTAVIDITVDATSFGIPFTDSARYKSVQHRDVRADAYGDLTLWAGSYNNTLRVKEVSETRDSIWVRTFTFWTLYQDSTYTDSTFTWWDASKGYYLMEAAYAGPDLDRITYQDPNPVAVAPSISSEVKVYPNPATDRLVVELGGAGYSTMHLTDIQGRTLREIPLHGPRTELDLQGLAPGMYLYHMRSDEGASTRAGKLMVRH